MRSVSLFTEGDGQPAADEVPQKLEPLLRTIRRHLHQHPELGFEEVQTSAYIRETLEQHGLEVHGPLASTGLYVDIVGEHPGPMIAYRADIDALPTPDAKTDVPYRSTVPGKAHLCGHDAHTTIGIGVALLLDARRDQLHGSVRVFFQPNEEGLPSGAPSMMADGVLDGVQAAYAIHVDPTLEAGTYGFITGAATASADKVRIVLSGPASGHSARPHQSTDTIWVTTQIMNTLYQLAGRITDARNPAVLTFCRIHAGEAYNVIPQSVEFGGTLRCTNLDDRDQLREEITRVAQETAARYGADVEVDIEFGAPPVVNDPMLIANAHRTVKELMGEHAVHHIPVPSMGAEDFAHYLTQVPGALLRVGTSNSPATSFPLHHACFDIAEETLAPTANVMARTLIRHLRDGI